MNQIEEKVNHLTIYYNFDLKFYNVFCKFFILKKEKKSCKKCCKVCNIWIDSKSMDQHLKGKKHIAVINQMFKKKRMETQINSEGIYITGMNLKYLV